MKVYFGNFKSLQWLIKQAAKVLIYNEEDSKLIISRISRSWEINWYYSDEAGDTAPTRCEFTFDAGAANNARKRKTVGAESSSVGGSGAEAEPVRTHTLRQFAFETQLRFLKCAKCSALTKLR